MAFVTADDGARIHHQLAGPESGTPLVLLHGLSMNQSRWRSRPIVSLGRMDLRGLHHRGRPERVLTTGWAKCDIRGAPHRSRCRCT
jgi:pimeloyl-ACP methyl ester carboxylesterase